MRMNCFIACSVLLGLSGIANAQSNHYFSGTLCSAQAASEIQYADRSYYGTYNTDSVSSRHLLCPVYGWSSASPTIGGARVYVWDQSTTAVIKCFLNAYTTTGTL